MNKKDRIEREIQKTLNELGKETPLPPDPWFYTRLQARIRERSIRRTSGSWSLVLKPAGLALLILLNVGTLIWYTSGSGQSASSSANYDIVSVLKSDFGGTHNSIDIFTKQ